MLDAHEIIASELGVPVELVAFAVDGARREFRKIFFKKRNGGTRVALQPSVKTKMVQAWLDARILSKLPVSSAATGFVRDCSIVDNARHHKGCPYLIRIDLESFFPSIKFRDLAAVLTSPRNAQLPPYTRQPDILEVLRLCCFDKTDSLPVGYPTSPKIANVVMKEIDEILMFAIAGDQEKFGEGALTRYADDFVFSTNKRGACAEFEGLLHSTLRSVGTPCLRVNSEKTRLMSRAAGSALVTGLRIKEAGQIGVHANYRDHVRLLLRLYASGRLSASEVPSLSGHLSFIQHADPSLYTKLSFRYFAEIDQIRRGLSNVGTPVEPGEQVSKAA